MRPKRKNQTCRGQSSIG